MTPQVVSLGRNSSLPENRIEIRQHVRRIPLLEANKFAGNLAVSVDHVGFRIHRGAIGLSDRRVIVFGERITIGWEDYTLFAEKFFISRRILIGGNSQNDAAPRLDMFLQAIQCGSFLDARRAPGRPEIEYHHFALQVGQMAGRSEEHTSELQSPDHLVCRLLLEKKKIEIVLRLPIGLAW